MTQMKIYEVKPFEAILNEFLCSFNIYKIRHEVKKIKFRGFDVCMQSDGWRTVNDKRV